MSAFSQQRWPMRICKHRSGSRDHGKTHACQEGHYAYEKQRLCVQKKDLWLGLCARRKHLCTRCTTVDIALSCMYAAGHAWRLLHLPSAVSQCPLLQILQRCPGHHVMILAACKIWFEETKWVCTTRSETKWHRMEKSRGPGMQQHRAACIREIIFDIGAVDTKTSVELTALCL